MPSSTQSRLNWKRSSLVLIDRFRSLPMSRWAVLAARSIAELLTQMIGAVVVVCVGLAIGWRAHTGAAEVIEAFALALLFGYAFTWAGICLGMALRSLEAAPAERLHHLPAADVHLQRVRPHPGHAGWLQPVATWNPMSALAAAAGSCSATRTPAAAVHAWPMQHPELAAVCWAVVMLMVFAPLAVHLYRRKALG